MKKIKYLSTASTVICLFSLIFYILFALFIYFNILDLFMGFAGESMDKLDQVDSNSPSAGFEVIFYLTGGALGFLSGLFSLLFSLFFGFLALYQIPAIISGFVANNNYKRGYDALKCLKSYRTDALLKAIMNGIVVAFVMLIIITNLGSSSIFDIIVLLGMVWNYIAVLILSIFQMNSVADTERNFNIYRN